MSKRVLGNSQTKLVARARLCLGLQRHSSVLPDPELTEYAYALAKSERYQEALNVLDTLENPNTPRALNYRGYATRKLGRTDEGITYYLKSVALDPNYPQVREYLGEAYVIQGKFDLAKNQLDIEKLVDRKVRVLQDLRALERRTSYKDQPTEGKRCCGTGHAVPLHEAGRHLRLPSLAASMEFERKRPRKPCPKCRLVNGEDARQF